jgi:NarL family two-component system response regulator LiaR
MSYAVSRAPIQICPVAENCLAEAYLDQLLRRDSAIEVLNLKRDVAYGPSRRKSVIFVIDQFGFEIPLYDCLKQLRCHCPDAKFLLLDHHKTKDEMVRILIMGAHGYVPHADAPTTLLRAILAIASNQLWVPPEVLSEFLREVNCVLHKNSHSRQTTTPRENEILELMRRRLSNREIADLMEISVSTVKFHVSNILSKLHAKNRRDLAEASCRHSWKMQL